MSNETQKRRWCRFSLKTLLLMTAVMCIGFAWIGTRLHRARENRSRVTPIKDAVAEIEELGGRVRVYYHRSRSPTWLESQFDDPGSSDDPVIVPDVQLVEFPAGAQITDACLGRLQSLPGLKFLIFHDPSVTDAHLQHLKQLAMLEILTLSGTNVTDEGVEELQRALPNCRVQQFP